MATLHAITPIVHGDKDGKVTNFEVGDELSSSDFTDEQLQSLVDGGSAVEIGKDRKYSAPPQASDAATYNTDPATLKRDQLIQAAMQDGDVPQGVIPQQPSVATVDGTPGGELKADDEDDSTDAKVTSEG